MPYIGFTVTCIVSILIGLYFNERLLGIILKSPLGFSGEQQNIKDDNLKRLLQEVSAAFGAGASFATYLHHANWLLVVSLILLLCLLPAILFASMRMARLAAIAIETQLDQWISRRG